MSALLCGMKFYTQYLLIQVWSWGGEAEKIIDIFAHGIYQVLQDNEGLFRDRAK